MVEIAKKADGKTAYSVVIGNLESAWINPEILAKIYPENYFHFTERKADGLALPHRFVCVKTSSGIVIERTTSKLIIKDNKASLRLVSNFCNVGGEISDEAIEDIIAFTEDVKTKVAAYANEKIVSSQ
jgi:hypothetical protein